MARISQKPSVGGPLDCSYRSALQDTEQNGEGWQDGVERWRVGATERSYREAEGGGNGTNLHVNHITAGA